MQFSRCFCTAAYQVKIHSFRRRRRSRQNEVNNKSASYRTAIGELSTYTVCRHHAKYVPRDATHKHLHDTYTGCITYADDIVLIAASVTMLQKMIDVVAEEASNIDMTLMLANQLLFVLARIISMHVFHYSC